MASSLNIIGNHKIEFNNGQNVIKQVEELLGIEVKNGTYKTLNGKEKTVNESDIELYSSYEHLQYNFEKWKMVKIISTYIPCYEITILEKTALLYSNILIKYWKPLLLMIKVEKPNMNIL